MYVCIFRSIAHTTYPSPHRWVPLKTPDATPRDLSRARDETNGDDDAMDDDGDETTADEDEDEDESIESERSIDRSRLDS